VHDARINSQWEKWKACLEGIRSEINAKLKEPQKTECDEKEADIINAIGQYYKAKRLKKKSNVNPRTSLYAYELYIGELEEKTGMGMPGQEDDGL